MALVRGTQVHRYTILDRIGEGGMGVVYAAYDPGLDRRVALKFLNADRAERGQVQEARLLREAQAMGRLSHPNVAVAYEVGLFGQHVFLAMEFVDGQDLRTWLSRKALTTSEIIAVFLAAGRGLAAAHAAGIIHRDFKPANVLVDKHDRPRVTDFGLARATEDGEEGAEHPGTASDPDLSPGDHLAARLTRTGAVLGTPSYMSPEQHVGDKVDERSDQFSFCVALYEALYEEHPSAELLRSLLSKVLSPASLSQSPSSLPCRGDAAAPSSADCSARQPTGSLPWTPSFRSCRTAPPSREGMSR